MPESDGTVVYATVPPWDIHLFIAWSSPWYTYPWTLSNICGQTHDGVVSRHIAMANVCKVFEMLAQSVFNGFGGWQILCFNSSCF